MSDPYCAMVYICTIGILLERRQVLRLVPLMVGGAHMSCPALPTEGVVDDESFSWAVSILALGYLACPIAFYFCITFIITPILVYHICSNKLYTKKIVIKKPKTSTIELN